MNFMMKRLMLLVILLAAGFASLAEAKPCVTQTAQPAAKMVVDCMAAMGMTPQADHAAMKGCATVSECFKQPALPGEVSMVTAPSSHEHTTYAILPESIQPVAMLGQQRVRPPPLEQVARYTPTHKFLASLSRWLI